MQLHTTKRNWFANNVESTESKRHFSYFILANSRFHWPRGLRRRSVAAPLLDLWVRIPSGTWMLSLVRVVYCHVEVSATGRSPDQRSSTDCKPQECGGPGLRWAAEPEGEIFCKHNGMTHGRLKCPLFMLPFYAIHPNLLTK